MFGIKISAYLLQNFFILYILITDMLTIGLWPIEDMYQKIKKRIQIKTCVKRRYENMAISVEEIEKVRDYVLKQIMNENRCLIIGPEDLMNRFCEDNGIRIDYIMVDSLNIDNEIESEPVKIYNAKSREVLLLSLTDKDSLANVITQGRRMAGMVESTNEEKTLLKHLLGAELVKKRYRDGYQPSADLICASSDKEKIKMIYNIFRRPPEKTINDMRSLLEDRSIIELDKRFDRSVKQNPQIPHVDPNERLRESLGVDENRFNELQKILLKLSKLSTSSGNLDDILYINHETFLDLLEKEEGINNKERLYLAFGLGKLLQAFATEMSEKISHLEEDHDERIKSIGKRHACEITKSLTLSKIDNLEGLNLREKLKSSLWAGVHNEKFYGGDKR